MGLSILVKIFQYRFNEFMIVDHLGITHTPFTRSVYELTYIWNNLLLPVTKGLYI